LLNINISKFFNWRPPKEAAFVECIEWGMCTRYSFDALNTNSAEHKTEVAMYNSQDDIGISHSDIVNKQRGVERRLRQLGISREELENLAGAQTEDSIEQAAARIRGITQMDLIGIPSRFIVEAAGWALLQPSI